MLARDERRGLRRNGSWLASSGDGAAQIDNTGGFLMGDFAVAYEQRRLVTEPRAPFFGMAGPENSIDESTPEGITS